MVTMPQALGNVKDYFATYVPAALVRGACADAAHQWRERQLGPVVTTYLFLKQALHGNTACAHLRHLSGAAVNPSAYCQARARLPLAFYEALQRRVTDAVRADLPRSARPRWQGHRLFFLDGSGFSMPDTPGLQKQFGQPGGQRPGCGFPVAHLMALFDWPTGMLRQTLALPLRSHDAAHAAALHPALRPGDVLVGDRAFSSYAHLALCRRRRLHGLFRVHQKQLVSFRPHRRHQTPQAPDPGRPTSRWLRRLGHRDQVVECARPPQRPAWVTKEQWQQLPATLVVREVRYRVRVPGVRTKEVTLVTTLLDAERYPAKELARLYGLRWLAETHLRHLKQTLGLDVLHCTTVAGVLKELTMFVIVYNLVRRVMAAAAARQKVGPERISFIDAWRWLQQAQPTSELPDLVVNPERPGRYEPRARKRRPKEFSVMKRPRDELRKGGPTKRSKT
jgi:hypothetical protein